MNRYIGLLRGINVSGQKRILMADLRDLLIKSGLSDVTTYIQSGNLVFRAPDRMGLEDHISGVILQHYGFDVPVIVRTSEEIQKLLNDCPFSEVKKQKGYFLLYDGIPKAFTPPDPHDYPGETFVITPKGIYLHFENGAGRAKLNNNFFEKKMGVTATTRNYRTLKKLLELAGS